MAAKIRVAVETDVDAVLRIERGCATAPHWQEDDYKRIVRGDGPVQRVLLVAEVGEVVGFVVGSIVAGVGELENLAVREDWRGRGFGRVMCEEILDWFREQRAEVVQLEVREGSLGARRLYERLGFMVVGRRRGYYSAPSEDGVLFQIGLEASHTQEVGTV